MNTRKILFLLTILCCVVVLAQPTQAGTQLEFWTTEVDSKRIATIRYLTQAFQAENPDIEIHVTTVDENSMRYVGNSAEEGIGPDILSGGSDLMVSLGKKGTVNRQCVKQVLTRIGHDRFLPGCLSRLRMPDGDYAGIPHNGWVQAIWYRSDWFEQAGLAPPDTPQRILAAAKALHNPAVGRYGILLGTRADTYAEQVFTHLALAAGVHEFDRTGKVAFDSPGTVKTVELYKELAKYTPPSPQSWRGRDFYLHGRLAMMFYSTFIMDDLALASAAANSLTGDNFPELEDTSFDPQLLHNTRMVSVIHGKQDASYGVIHALTVLGSVDPEKNRAICRFVRFLFRPDAYIVWLHMAPGGMLPVLKKTSSQPEFYQDFSGVFQRYSREHFKALIKGLDNVQSFSFQNGNLIPAAAQSATENIIPEMLVDVIHRNADPKEAVRKAANRMRNAATP